jgi:2-keto-4-pentenoate hydratase/2-oxohepta-3-ene-1,7-dioic acid hydratase in catechol pathway
MKLARVRYDGQVWLGRVDPDEMALLHRESDHPCADALGEALALGVDLTAPGKDVQHSDVTVLSPVVRPSKLIPVALNYSDHARESGLASPLAPLYFAKFASAIIGPGDDIVVAAGDTSQLDYEVELAVVIGARCRRVPVDRALAHVLGVTVANDVSARDAQFADGQFVRAKSYDTFCPLGPVIATMDEIPDIQNLALTTHVNGVLRQRGGTTDMIFGVAEIVAYVSRFSTLEPGDVLLTGTPAGVGLGRTPPVFLGDGDEVTVAIEGVGSLTNRVRIETP